MDEIQDETLSEPFAVIQDVLFFNGHSVLVVFEDDRSPISRVASGQDRESTVRLLLRALLLHSDRKGSGST